MQLHPMRYKDFLWPHNPSTYTISFERQVAVHKVPFGRYCTQDLGLSCRVMRGEGVFAGKNAYEDFKRLAAIFYKGGPGLLIHPVWQSANAFFIKLELTEEPLPDYVHYSFAFREQFDGYSNTLQPLDSETDSADMVGRTLHTVVSDDTLWAIAQRYGVSLSSLLAVNTGIKNPNLICVGEQVVIPC